MLVQQVWSDETLVNILDVSTYFCYYFDITRLINCVSS